MVKVVLRQDENVDNLIRRFKQVVKKEDILYDCKRHEYFMPTALKRKEKSINARKKSKKR